MPRFRTGGSTGKEYFNGKHRFEHWYRDNTIYFITARCRNGVTAFNSTEAKWVFWDRYRHYASAHGYTPIVTTLMNNHYHSLGHLRIGLQLGEMMRRFHGSVAKLVNDTLEARLVPFWNEDKRYKHNYFDGCIRDERQMRRAYRYTLMQSVRARIVTNWREYPHTCADVELEAAVRRAIELNAFLETVPYKRYER